MWLNVDAGERETRRLRRARRRVRSFDGSRASRVLRGATKRAKCWPRSREFLADPRSAQNRPRSEADGVARRTRARHPPRHHALFLFAAPHHRASTTCPTSCCATRTRRFPARPASAPTSCSASRRCCARKWKRRNWPASTKKSICRSRRVLAAMERHGIRVDPDALAAMSASHGKRDPRTRKAHLGTGRRGIQRQFAAATRRNSLRQNESRHRRQAQPRQGPLHRRRRPHRAWRSCTNCRAKCSNTANWPS